MSLGPVFCEVLRHILGFRQWPENQVSRQGLLGSRALADVKRLSSVLTGSQALFMSYRDHLAFFAVMKWLTSVLAGVQQLPRVLAGFWVPCNVLTRDQQDYRLLAGIQGKCKFIPRVHGRGWRGRCVQ